MYQQDEILQKRKNGTCPFIRKYDSGSVSMPLLLLFNLDFYYHPITYKFQSKFRSLFLPVEVPLPDLAQRANKAIGRHTSKFIMSVSHVVTSVPRIMFFVSSPPFAGGAGPLVKTTRSPHAHQTFARLAGHLGLYFLGCLLAEDRADRHTQGEGRLYAWDTYPCGRVRIPPPPHANTHTCPHTHTHIGQ